MNHINTFDKMMITSVVAIVLIGAVSLDQGIRHHQASVTSIGVFSLAILLPSSLVTFIVIRYRMKHRD